MSQNILNAILNFFLVSVPEEIFLTVMTLIFMKRFDLLDIRMWRQNIKWIMIPVIPVAILINLFRYIVVIPKPIMSLSMLVVMMCLMIFIVVKNSFDATKRMVFKVVIFTFLSFIMVGILETLYTPILLMTIHRSMDFVNNNIFYNFLLSLPSRIFEMCIILFIIVKKNNDIQVNLFNTIVKNRFFTGSFLALTFLILISIIYLCKLFTVDNILINLGIINQIIVVIIATSVPIVLITWFLMFINYLLTREKSIQQAYENLIIKDDMVDVDD